MYNLYICCGLLLALFVLCLCFILFLSCAFPDLFTMGCLVMSGGNYLSSSMVITLSMGLPAAYLGWSLWQHPWFCTTEHPPFSLGSHSLAGSFHPAFFLDFPSLGMRYIFFSVDQDGDYSFNVQFHDYYLLICGFIPFFIGDAVTVSFADCLE